MKIILHDNLDGSVHYQAVFDTPNGPTFYNGTADDRVQAHFALQKIARVHGHTLVWRLPKLW